jgi:hypothetical protein
MRNLRCLVPLVYLIMKFYGPSSSDFSPFQISHALLQWFISVRNFMHLAPLFISVRNFACLAPVVLLVSAIKLWAEENFRIYLIVLFYTSPEQTSCTLSHIISGPWRKFRQPILCCSHFTSSYILWEISKHCVGDIHQWRSFHTRIRENQSTASKVVKGSHKRDGGLKNPTFFLRVCEGKCVRYEQQYWERRRILLSYRYEGSLICSLQTGLAKQIEATIMPRLAVLCNSGTPGCWTPQSQYLLSK